METNDVDLSKLDEGGQNEVSAISTVDCVSYPPSLKAKLPIFPAIRYKLLTVPFVYACALVSIFHAEC